MTSIVRGRWLVCGLSLVAAVGMTTAGLAWDDAEPPIAPGPAAPAALPGLASVPVASPEAPAPPTEGLPAIAEVAESAAVAQPPRAEARVEGGPQPGSTVLLRGDGSAGDRLRFRWLQTAGPKVRLATPEGPTASFVMPAEPGTLRFLLVVSGPGGSDTAEVGLGAAAGGGPRAGDLRADAGDDQIALIGRQVTLNGSRSEPAGRIGHRWIQTGGPAARLKVEDGAIFAFTPTAPGVYRFALVVATGSELSAPDEVIVTVGAGARIGGPAGVAASGERPEPEPTPVQEVARAALASVRGGAEAAESLAGTFEATADRMDLYGSYSDAYSEMSRRLDDVLPADPTHRNVWVERLFGPLSARTVEAMRVEGLDLRQPEALAAALTTPQKAALAEHFRLIAEGFRSTNRPR